MSFTEENEKATYLARLFTIMLSMKRLPSRKTDVRAGLSRFKFALQVPRNMLAKLDFRSGVTMQA